MALNKEQLFNAMKVEQASCDNCARPGFYGKRSQGQRVWYKDTRRMPSHEYPYRNDKGSPFCKLCSQGDGLTRWKYDGKSK